jgi:hypothetical protein
MYRENINHQTTDYYKKIKKNKKTLKVRASWWMAIMVCLPLSKQEYK